MCKGGEGGDSGVAKNVGIWAGFRGHTRSEISWSQPERDFVVSPFIMKRFRSGVVTDLDKSYVQVLVETKKKKQTRSSPQIKEVFGQIVDLHHKMVSPQNDDTRSGRPS